LGSIAPTPDHAGIWSMCVADKLENRSTTAASWSRISLDCCGNAPVFQFLRRTPNPQSCFAKSGNKIPTIVQKFYTRLGKNLHEIENKFFWGSLGGGQAPQNGQFGTQRAYTLVTQVFRIRCPAD
jgi:hypothetical protein